MVAFGAFFDTQRQSLLSLLYPKLRGLLQHGFAGSCSVPEA